MSFWNVFLVFGVGCIEHGGERNNCIVPEYEDSMIDQAGYCRLFS